jgi:type IV secretory pathway TrbL component
VFFVLAYAIMAIQVFVIQVELAITTVAALVMLPFAVLRGTGWIASGAISSLINVGFRFFLLALLASLVFPVLGQLTAVSTAFESVFLMVIVPWTMVLLFWKAPAIAAGMLAGHPSLTAGQVVRAGVGTAMMVGAGAGLMNAGGRTALRGLSTVTNKASGGRITLPAPAAPRQPTRQVVLQTLSHSARFLTA